MADKINADRLTSIASQIDLLGCALTHIGGNLFEYGQSQRDLRSVQDILFECQRSLDLIAANLYGSCPDDDA